MVTASSLYGYGPVSVPMVEQIPDSATDEKGKFGRRCGPEAKQRHDEGRIRAVEVRAADYLGPGVGRTVTSLAMFPQPGRASPPG